MLLSLQLRMWFSHDVERWREFKQRYLAELRDNRDAWRPIVERADRGNVTLLYAARDTEHNNAVVLEQFLRRHIHQ